MKPLTKNEKNLKLYPYYGLLARDFIFYYTIDVLFLTQVKGISISSVVLIDTFYSLFVFLVQLPATMLVNKIGLKKSIVLGNLCNIIYLILFMYSKSVLTLTLATSLCSLGFALKDTAQPALLNESINKSKKEKSMLLATIQSKSVSGYHVLCALSLAISGFLYNINGYIPIFMSLIIVFIAFLLSLRFYEPTYEEEKLSNNKENNIKDAITFVFKSRRCRCLILFSGIFTGIASVLLIYEVSLLENLNISATIIGILFAILNIISAIASKMQDLFQNVFKNRTLTVLGTLLGLTCILSGLIAGLKIPLYLIFTGIVIMYILKYTVVALSEVMMVKYLSNFTNHDIDTKIFAINSGICCFFNMIFGLIGAKISSYFPIDKTMLIFGSIALVIILVMLKNMKNKVGLNPINYTDYELQYDKTK